MKTGSTVRILVFAASPLFYAQTAFATMTDQSEPSSDIQRHCIGLLWCTERFADGTSVDGLLWLYSAEERGSYSRLAVRPFYSMEEDPTRNLLRRSILWPLGTYERRGNQAWAHVFPLYWHSERPGREWTFTVPLYIKLIHGDSSWHHLAEETVPGTDSDL